MLHANHVSSIDMHHFDRPPCKLMWMLLEPLFSWCGSNGGAHLCKNGDDRLATIDVAIYSVCYHTNTTWYYYNSQNTLTYLQAGVSSSRLRPDSDQSRIWCRARPWLGCDSLNELTWVGFVVHWYLTIFFFFFFLSFRECSLTRQRQSTECDARYMVQRKKFDVILRLLVDRYWRTKPPKPDASQFVVPARLPEPVIGSGGLSSSRFDDDVPEVNCTWTASFSWRVKEAALWFESHGSKNLTGGTTWSSQSTSTDWLTIQCYCRDRFLFLLSLGWISLSPVFCHFVTVTSSKKKLIDENTPLEQSTIETCLQEAYKYQKVTKISCDIWSRFEAWWLDCVRMMSEMTIAVIVVSASCHHLTRADSGWSRISWFSRMTLPWLRGGTSVAPWRHKSSHVPVFRRLFDRLPVRISTSDLYHQILRKKLYHIRAYDFGVQFSFNLPLLLTLPHGRMHGNRRLRVKMAYSHNCEWV